MKAEIFEFGKKAVFTVSKFAPKALMGVSAGATVGSIFLAVKAGMEYQQLKESGEPITAKDYLRIFGPPAAAGVFALACAFAGLDKSERRYAAAAALVNTYETTQKELDAKAREIFGDSKVDKLHDEVNKERMNSAPAPAIISENRMYFDCLTRQYIYKDIETIRHKVNELNERINKGHDVCVEEWCDTLDLQARDYETEIGWNSQLTGIIRFRMTYDRDARGLDVAAIELETDCLPKLLHEVYEEEIPEWFRQRNPGWSEV